MPILLMPVAADSTIALVTFQKAAANGQPADGGPSGFETNAIRWGQ